MRNYGGRDAADEPLPLDDVLGDKSTRSRKVVVVSVDSPAAGQSYCFNIVLSRRGPSCLSIIAPRGHPGRRKLKSISISLVCDYAGANQFARSGFVRF